MKKSLTARELSIIGIFTAMTAVLAQIAIPLPFTPIPFSLGMVGVYITGMLLKPGNAVLTQVCYLCLGAVGVPVFGNFRGGFGALFGPTGGCLMVYPVMAAIISLTLNSTKSQQAEYKQSKQLLYLKTSIALCLAICTEYLGGAIWLTATSTAGAANTLYGSLTLVCFPFIPFDIIKIVLCVTAMLPFRARLMSTNMLLLGDNRSITPQIQKNSVGEKVSNPVLEKALDGQSLTVEEANTLIDPKSTPLDEIMQTANTITRRHFGNEISMCAIYAAKVGRCSGDCAFCAQSAHHDCDVWPIEVSALNGDEIIENAKELWRLGVSSYSLVTSGEELTDAEFDRILHIFQRLNSETEIGLCASLGSLTLKRAVQLKDAGVTRYHHNIETSRSYFPQICSTHSYDDKISTLNIVRQAGMDICCGGIIAMGETLEQRVEMAFALKELDVDCIPINILNPICGTRLEHQKPLDTYEILRTIAVFRLILPDKVLKFAGGREKALGGDEYKGYSAGINSILVGNYLTTSGKDFNQEVHNLEAIGLAVKYAQKDMRKTVDN